MRLSAGTGGAVLRIMVRYGTAWFTMAVAYLPAATAVATVGSMCAVSRLHKLIPVYSFYSYWRIKCDETISVASIDSFRGKW